MAFPTKRIIKKRRVSSGGPPSDPVASAYAPPALTGEVIDKRPARNRRHPHPSTGDFYRVQAPTLPKLTATVPERGTLAHQTAVERNLEALPPEMRRSELEIYDEAIERGHRPAFAALTAHREMAATVLGIGGSNAEAADYAGISEATVKGYLADEQFRTRVAELRALTMSGVQGRIVKHLEVLTTAENLKEMEIADVLRIYDRTAGPKSGNKVEQNVTINNKYDTIIAAITSPDSDEEGEDFPGYGAAFVPVPGGGTQVVRKVPRARLGSPSG